VFSQLTEAVYTGEYHQPDEARADGQRATQFARQVRRLEGLLPPSRRRLLDVGCGAGAFLRFALDQGWDAAGTDVVLTSWAKSTGARLWEGQLASIDFGVARFDAVRFNHVLEHTPDPLAELKRARELLTGDGILLIGVPNLGGFSTRLKSWQSRLRLKRKRWRHYGALHHFWFFTPRTLGRLIQAARFTPVYWETPVPDRAGRLLGLSVLYRALMETTRSGSVMDFYATAADRVPSIAKALPREPRACPTERRGSAAAPDA
jgi:SAM-dependent methyltransferase